MKNRRLITIFELTLIILSTIAFAYFVSTNLPNVFEKESQFIQYLTRPIVPTVSALSGVPSGCCKETLRGSSCQEMPLTDKNLCKTDLIGTSCSVVSECQKGCCYDSDSGICSLNAPKEKCKINGGDWDSSSVCNIPECQLVCCLLGDSAAMMTKKECTEVANIYRIEKVFKPLDNKGTCDSYSDQTDMGACLFKSDDYSNKMNCIFTTKAKCTGSGRDFRRNYLCTSKELNTTCEKTTKTTCIDGDDRVYFTDSCGNKANVYDSARANDDNYWNTIILPKNSCFGSPETCGNCDYTTGSICTKYTPEKNMVKPVLGNYVCKNLNCANGKKHGESWCISDATNVSRVGYAVGTRNYIASCFEGEIQIEGCADFNQEICIENKAEVGENTEAACIVNDWRSCIYANDEDNYDAVKVTCDRLPQCAMFNELPGNEKYKGLPGFKENILNSKQGSAGIVGTDANNALIQCVPRFTPGFQFWTNTPNKNSQVSANNYGGGKSETEGLCSLGKFTCVSRIITEAPLSPRKKVYDAENPECNMQAVDQSKQKVGLMMEAMNEKCRMLGSCGIQYNTQGEIGKNKETVSRAYITKDGKLRNNYSTNGYVLPENYLVELSKNPQDSVKFGEIKTLNELTEKKDSILISEEGETLNSDMFNSYGIGTSMTEIGIQVSAATEAAKKEYERKEKGTLKIGIYALSGVIGLTGISLLVAANLYVGRYVGEMAAEWVSATPGESSVIQSVASYVSAGLFFMAAYSAATQGEDHEYYITEFKCGAWQPPLTGKCEACNDDVRPCTEFKCRSIGNNCKYFVENGEPGYCATAIDTWSAKITPWNEIINSGNKYSNISSSGFKIVSNESSSQEVKAWKQVKFGIVTDKPAICKLDTNHSKSYDEMRYFMMSDKNYNTGRNDGLQHWIALSPHTLAGENEVDLGITTPPLEEGENEYYIICQNYAGTTNKLPFVVQVKQADGPDLSPADITRTTPEDSSYIAYNTTNMTFWVYLDEPAECKYSIEYDYNFYEEMPNNFSCLTGKDNGLYGEWPCMAELVNITPLTKVFVKCKDQPELNETDTKVRNVNRRSFEYEFLICKEGLKINSIEPYGIVDINRSREVTMKVSTSGCINGGEANCLYRMPEFGNIYSLFLDTGKDIHLQPLTNLVAGVKKVDIECMDIAGNSANASINFTVSYDDSAPKIIRAYSEGEKIIIETDEEANCGVSTNETSACGFTLTSSSFIKKHAITLTDKSKKQTLYIKCADQKGNAVGGCTEIIKLTELKRGK